MFEKHLPRVCECLIWVIRVVFAANAGRLLIPWKRSLQRTSRQVTGGPIADMCPLGYSTQRLEILHNTFA